MPVPRLRTALAIAIVAAAALAAPARGAFPHRVVPGETLWSIAAANNFTTRTIASFNGLAVDSSVYAGETIQIPTEAEGAAALSSAGTTSSGSASSSGTSLASHTVTLGESLWSIASANGLSPYALAAENGLSANSFLYVGQTIKVPWSSAATSSSGTTTTSAGSPPPADPPYWTSPVYCPSCPSGEAPLASNAAANWNAMRQASLSEFGIDLYPAGPLSAYRSYAQQLYLYNLYLSGRGGLAAVPGTSSHEYGIAIDLADPSMRTVVDQIGASYGWAKTEASEEWWHVNYIGP